MIVESGSANDGLGPQKENGPNGHAMINATQDSQALSSHAEAHDVPAALPESVSCSPQANEVASEACAEAEPCVLPSTESVEAANAVDVMDVDKIDTTDTNVPQTKFEVYQDLKVCGRVVDVIVLRLDKRCSLKGCPFEMFDSTGIMKIERAEAL